MEKSQIVKENIEKLLDNRAEFYALFDEKIPKFGDTDVFDFKNAKDCDIKEIYEKFHKYDYAIRKLLPYLYEAYGVKFNV
ncbi:MULTISPECIES: CmeU family protein [unclassified Campylobacter]|uniref:CmeU family protein n=1 Tax=unclassified Campylobacter TaxID=2593542 RepID=UPI0022E9B0C0|nr:MULTISPECIES: CmeU family protein [unclassified Campylobacter]MDA3056167.1 hypothetical protein [Campylobacter sp. CN_NA1]MDA3065312.1 hypothetical protein [Campylobacter sp. CN_NE4]MDA3068138.1 hypothetical protein [Campylobacter sp. CN_NE3]MDA3082765.1 hypothetical protein [Campylobacter sp. CN_EL2]MDA3083497.1 hypothetical protein [Campylobacter sp. CN_NE1]